METHRKRNIDRWSFVWKALFVNKNIPIAVTGNQGQ
jgi:hypothetical protein